MERARRVQSVVSLLQLAQQVEPRLDEPAICARSSSTSTTWTRRTVD